MSLSPRPTSTYRGAEEQEWEEWAWVTGEAESGAELGCSEPSLGYLGCQGLLRTQLGVSEVFLPISVSGAARGQCQVDCGQE